MEKQIKMSDCSISQIKQTVSKFIESYSAQLFGEQPRIKGAKNRFGELKIAEEVVDMKEEIRARRDDSNIFVCDRGVMATLLSVLIPHWCDDYKIKNYVLALLADRLHEDDFDISTIGIISFLEQCSRISWSSECLKLKWDTFVSDVYHLSKVYNRGTTPLSLILNFPLSWGDFIHCYFFGQATVRSSETFSWRESLKWLDLQFEFNIRLLESGKQVYDCVIHAGCDRKDRNGNWCSAISTSEAARCANDSTDIL